MRLPRLLLALALLSGCSKSAPDASRHVDAANGFSIELPKGWTVKPPPPGGRIVLTAVPAETLSQISVHFETVPAGTTVEDYIKSMYVARGARAALTLIESEKESLDGRPAMRTVASITLKSGAVARKLDHVQIEGERLILVSGMAGNADFDELLPVMEKSCRSFRLEKRAP